MICILRLPDWVKDLPQESHLRFLCFSWLVLICFFRGCDWAKYFLQESHLQFLCPSLISLMWLLRFPFWVKYFPQESHLFFFCFSWISFLFYGFSCFYRYQILFHKICNCGIFLDYFQHAQTVFASYWRFCCIHCTQSFSLHHERFEYDNFCFDRLKMLFHKFRMCITIGWESYKTYYLVVLLSTVQWTETIVYN